MSYQALLFCLDERLARVVVQVFSELEFTVELVNEPFAAVKKLMAQRYDAVVVDCENEPNATLLFKSARNSSSNQSSLALALVEGQAGVAKAYRIGANLVLTKPINVEQAKGTLRVARGLLRKNVDPTSSPAAPAKPAPTPAAAPVQPPVRSVPAIENVAPTVAPSTFEVPEFAPAQPAIAASAKVEEIPIAAPAPEVKTKVFAESEAAVRNVLPSTLFEAVQPAASPSSFSGASAAAASAPALAKEPPAPPATKPVIATTVVQTEVSTPMVGLGSSPSFSALDAQDSGDSGGSKKIMVIAAIVLVAAVLGYFGWSSLNKGNAPSHSANAEPIPVAATPSVPANNTAATTSPSTPSESVRVTSQPVPLSSKPSASISTPTLAISPDEEVTTTTKKSAPAIVVKSTAPAKKVAAPVDDSAVPVPNPLAVATPTDKNLSGLVSSVPTALPTARLGTLKISQGVSQGLLIKRVTPHYPPNALSMRIQGSVVMEATINKEGNITNLKQTSGDAVLGRAAAEAVKQWRYKPYYLNGEPVEIQTQITVNFKLPN